MIQGQLRLCVTRRASCGHGKYRLQRGLCGAAPWRFHHRVHGRSGIWTVEAELKQHRVYLGGRELTPLWYEDGVQSLKHFSVVERWRSFFGHTEHCGLTLEATGTQQAPRSGNLLLCVRVGRPVMRDVEVETRGLLHSKPQASVCKPPLYRYSAFQ